MKAHILFALAAALTMVVYLWSSPPISGQVHGIEVAPPAPVAPPIHIEPPINYNPPVIYTPPPLPPEPPHFHAHPHEVSPSPTVPLQ